MTGIEETCGKPICEKSVENEDEETGKKDLGLENGPDEDEGALFDRLMEEIGNDGRFQKRFDFLYNFALVILLTMPYLNIILSMTIPEHWCHVPGMELTNYTLEEWKEIWLPKVNESRGLSYSSCKMYAQNGTRQKEIKDCLHGMDFDRQWYSETVPTEEEWVCDKEIYVSNTFAAGRIGEIIGTFVFGQLGDSYGRKPVFYISVAILVFGRTVSVFTSNHYIVFLLSIALGSGASTSIFQSPLVISMEVSDEKKRSHIAFLQCAGWVLGLFLLAFSAWALRDWKLIMLVSTLPNLICFLMYKLLPESPRWLAAKGRTDESVKVLKYIARINNTKLPENTYLVLEKIKNKKEKFYGMASLFSNWRLAKNTIIIIICWSTSGLCYYVITLNVTSMSGNPFMNFFWQSLVELPGYVLGKVLSDRLGRRWTQTGAYTLGGIFCSGTLIVQTLKADNLVIFFVVLIKLALTTSFYMVWLQAIEIYPTAVRQTGTSVGGMMSNLIGIVGPYITFLGTSVDQRLPYVIMLGIIILGCISSSFLPETLYKKLPETLDDAKEFGKDQKYWSWSLKKV